MWKFVKFRDFQHFSDFWWNLAEFGEFHEVWRFYVILAISHIRDLPGGPLGGPEWVPK